MSSKIGKGSILVSAAGNGGGSVTYLYIAGVVHSPQDNVKLAQLFEVQVQSNWVYRFDCLRTIHEIESDLAFKSLAPVGKGWGNFVSLVNATIRSQCESSVYNERQLTA